MIPLCKRIRVNTATLLIKSGGNLLLESRRLKNILHYQIHILWKLSSWKIIICIRLILRTSTVETVMYIMEGHMPDWM